MMTQPITEAGLSLVILFKDIAAVKSELNISMLSLDAREIKPNGLFLAVAGSEHHGLQFIDQAIANGALAVAYDPAFGGELLARQQKNTNIVLVSVESLAAKAGELACRFYQNPSAKMSVVGITGTNGKTSVSHYLSQALSVKGCCGVIGTLGWGLTGRLTKTLNTTPDAVSLQEQLQVMKQDGADVIAMEVSSHGLVQKRVSAVSFTGAIFTNLSQDHLDYHQTMEAYGEAKLRLFKAVNLSFVVLNLDDQFSAKIIQELAPNIAIFGLTRGNNAQSNIKQLQITNEAFSPAGLEFNLAYEGDDASIESPLLGQFSVDNLASSVAAQLGLGIEFKQAISNLKAITAVNGRMQRVLPDALASKSLATVVVDFAHTPQALESVLADLRGSCEGRLLVVFGCGGDRDQSKRSIMGEIAAEFADLMVITNDNPRSESPEQIAEQISSGIAAGFSSVRVELDRKKAIQLAIQQASSNDTVLIAGKGHEDYQEIAGVKLPFSDLACAEEALLEQNNSISGTNKCT